MVTKTSQLPLVWELRTAEGEVLNSLYEDTVPQELRDYVRAGETRRVYVRCARRAPSSWVYPPPTFPEPQPIGRGGIAINLTYQTSPEWRVGIYRKLGEVVFDRDPLRWPLPAEKIADQILTCGGITMREEVVNGVRRVLRKMRAKVPHVYPETEEDEEEDYLPPDLRADSDEYIEVE